MIGKETIIFQGYFGEAAYLLFQNILPAILSVNKWSVYLCAENDIIEKQWQGSEDTVQCNVRA